MTEQQARIAQQREEIAARIAHFKATQERFERERKEYLSRRSKTRATHLGARRSAPSGNTKSLEPCSGVFDDR
jgi:hypothetical protein